jgi:hypothetical protein
MTLRLEPRDTYLLAEMSGDYDARVTAALTIQFLDACVSHLATRLLVDLRALSGTITTLERYNYFDFLARQVHERIADGRLTSLKFAFIVNPALVDPDRFGQTVANNRGLSLQGWTEREPAVRWLEENL